MWGRCGEAMVPMEDGTGSAGRFDERARTWDDAPHRVERARVAAELIAARVPLGPTTHLLDYGAGTGLLAQHLAARVGDVALIEPSEGMQAVLRDKIDAGVLAGGRVLDLDLAVVEAPVELVCDVVVSLMVVHHVRDIPALLRRLRTIVPVDGHLCIVDLEEEDGSYHGPSFDGHHGLARGPLAEALVAAGFERPSFDHAFTIEKKGRAYDLFLAVARAV